jgi:uncharacterized repeat protein (TIGR03803 family)
MNTPTRFVVKEHRCLQILGIVAAFVFAAMLPPQLHSQTFTVLHSFTDTPDGAYPSGGVLLDPKGNVYVATAVGGTNNQGTVVRISPTGSETIMYSFGNIPDGNDPMANLLLDKFGNVYGTTYAGGSGFCFVGLGCGAIFKLSKGGRELWLTSFLGGTDGALPQRGSMVMDAAGNLYGTTGGGGGTSCPPYVGCGIVFKVDPNGVETVLYRFTGMPDASIPQSGLVMDGSGNLFGMTMSGGTFNQGAVFKITPQGEETVLHSFAGPPDGAGPLGDLSMDGAGNLYGTTTSGGTGTLCNDGGAGCGTIFKLDTQGNESILYSFKGAGDGFFPFGGVILDNKGNLFGTTWAGSFYNNGNVFAFSHDRLRVLHAFTGGADGRLPEAGLTRDPAGNLYGTAFESGAGCCGVVFKLYPYKNALGSNDLSLASESH